MISRAVAVVKRALALAGFLAVACAWMGLLFGGSHAGRAPPRRAAGDSCKLKELTALALTLVEGSSAAFSKANGEHLGTWTPGFPELRVHRGAPLDGSEVQCGLLFMSRGLKEVLADQRDRLNPTDTSLHQQLAHSISTVDLLAACARRVLGGECSQKPPAPKMPTYAFERKQWSHTLLKTARAYLDWMKKQPKAPEATVQTPLEGSGYLP